MRKCPRCGHNIQNNEKFCPHCGLDLQVKYRPIQQKKLRPIMMIIIFLTCMSLPMLLGELVANFSQGLNITKDKQIELKEVEGDASTVVGNYTTLNDFKKQFSNVDEVIQNIHLYEENLNQKYGHIFDKEYSITVFDNYDVLYQLKYTTQIEDNFQFVVETNVSRSQIINDEKMTFQKSHVNNFEDLLFNEQEQDYVQTYTDHQNITEQLMNDFSQRKAEFERKKEKLGHYGIGNYNGPSSFVAHRIDKEYYSKLVYSHRLTQTIHK